MCKYIHLRFIDSCRFVASSLYKLASNLEDDQCKHLMEFYMEDEVFRLMRKRGIWMGGRNFRRQVYHRKMRLRADLI